MVLALLAGCGGGGGDNSGGGTEPVSTTVQVKVRDALGFAKPGALVELVGATAGAPPTATATTGSDGRASLTVNPDVDLLLRISLAGHTQQFRPLRVAAGRVAYLEATLLARAPALTLPDAAAGGTLMGRNAARLSLPANALVDAQTGAPVTGAVQVEMTPVNTASHEISAFPGSMRARSGSTEGVLLTYGPVEYIFTQGGRRLALGSSKTAEIEMPLHATQGVNGTPLRPGDTMPVWSLDERTGIWLQEATGTVVASRSATGLALRATVSHFSWWNPDAFADPVTVNISFVFEGGVVPTACCQVKGLTVPGFPGPAGVASTTLPASGGSVIVSAPTVVIFSASGLSTTGALTSTPFDQAVPAGAGSINVTITMKLDPDAPNPVITSPAAGVTTYTRATLNVAASVSGGEPDLVQLLANGSLIGTMSGSPSTGYTVAWDTTGFAETSYALTVRARRGDTVVTSAARTVVVDRTPPLLTTRSPAPGANQVTASYVVTASFNEPLDPDSLVNLADPASPRVALLQGGLGSGTVLPAILELSADGQALTLTPAAPLAANFGYGVRMQGLTDRAGNPLALAEWSFSVPLFATVSPDLNVEPDGTVLNVIGRPELAVAPNGEPLVLWRNSPISGQFAIQVARRIGETWVRLPALLPAVPTNSATIGQQSMALDGSGQPVVAWTQSVPNTGGCGTTQPSQLFVARFNGSAWVPLGTGALNLGFCTAPSLPRLKIDALGRPVLLVAESLATLTFTLRVLRFEGGEWTLVGNVPGRSVPAASNVTELRLALQGNVPYVYSSENRSGAIGHFVSRPEGSAFVPVGPQIVLGNANNDAALMIDPAGRPVLAVTPTLFELQVWRFEGDAWARLGPALPTGTAGATEPSIVFDGGEPLVAWKSFSGFPAPALASRYAPATVSWGDPITINASVGRLAEWQRRPEGGPIWVAITSGPFNSRLRVVTTASLP
jgi:hypothetical protein